jgi:hypothetical protein
MLTDKLGVEAVGLCTIVRVNAGAFGDLGVSKNLKDGKRAQCMFFNKKEEEEREREYRLTFYVF